jgi:hypothetical protein
MIVSARENCNRRGGGDEPRAEQRRAALRHDRGGPHAANTVAEQFLDELVARRRRQRRQSTSRSTRIASPNRGST